MFRPLVRVSLAAVGLPSSTPPIHCSYHYRRFRIAQQDLLFIHAENTTALFAAMNLWKKPITVKSTAILGRKTCEVAWKRESRGKACQSVSLIIFLIAPL